MSSFSQRVLETVKPELDEIRGLFAAVVEDYQSDSGDVDLSPIMRKLDDIIRKIDDCCQQQHRPDPEKPDLTDRIRNVQDQIKDFRDNFRKWTDYFDDLTRNFGDGNLPRFRDTGSQLPAPELLPGTNIPNLPEPFFIPEAPVVPVPNAIPLIPMGRAEGKVYLASHQPNDMASLFALQAAFEHCCAEMQSIILDDIKPSIDESKDLVRRLSCQA